MFSIQELRSSTQKELLEELKKVRHELLKIRINIKTKHDKDTSKVRKTKRYLARLLTVLKEFPQEEKKKEEAAEEKKTEKKTGRRTKKS